MGNKQAEHLRGGNSSCLKSSQSDKTSNSFWPLPWAATLNASTSHAVFGILCGAQQGKILLQRRYSHAVDKSSGVHSDQTVIMTTVESAKVYPDALRRVTYFDVENQRRLKFLTNNFLPALTIAQICKSRWRMELFFKFIKQHLRISLSTGRVRTR